MKQAAASVAATLVVDLVVMVVSVVPLLLLRRREVRYLAEALLEVGSWSHSAGAMVPSGTRNGVRHGTGL